MAKLNRYAKNILFDSLLVIPCDDDLEELNSLSDHDPINEIKDYQSRHLEYDYENDPKTWIR